MSEESESSSTDDDDSYIDINDSLKIAKKLAKGSSKSKNTNYSCDVCGKNFPKHSLLYHHKRVHLGRFSHLYFVTFLLSRYVANITY